MFNFSADWLPQQRPVAVAIQQEEDFSVIYCLGASQNKDRPKSGSNFHFHQVRIMNLCHFNRIVRLILGVVLRKL